MCGCTYSTLEIKTVSDLHGKRCILSEVNSFIFSLFGLLCESPLVDPDCFFSKQMLELDTGYRQQDI